MRKLLLLLFTLMSLNNYGQWTSLNSGSTEWLRGVDFPSSSIGYTVGYNGTILKTTDGGLNWSTQTSGFSNNLNSVFFVNTTTGWACGDGGIILKTIDGGANWVNQGTTSGCALNEIFFLDAMNGYTTGACATCLKTTDGGANWTPLTLSGGVNGTVSLYFSDVNTGYIVGLGQADAIMKTTNAGTNWNNQHSSSFAEFGSVYFTHPDTGYVCSTGSINKNILKTTDGGTNWNIVHTFPSDGLYALKFPTSLKGYAAGGFSGSSMMLYTADAGATWVSQNTSISQPLFDCFFVNENLGYAVGMNGSIIKTLNGGVGINELDAIQLSIFPNPTSEQLTIDTKLKLKEIHIMDLSGKMVKQFTPAKSLNVSDIPNGIYFIKIMGEKNMVIKKFVKQ